MKNPAIPLAAAALLVALLSGCRTAETPTAVVRSEALTLTATLEPEAGRVGENTILLELETADGRPVVGAEISTRVHMHAMGAMPAMGGMASLEPLGDGRYRADFELDMGSTWLVEVRVRAGDGAELFADGSLTVGTPGLNLTARGTSARPQAKPDDAQNGEPHPATIYVDTQRLQQVGVRSAAVGTHTTAASIRAVGRVTYDETSLRDVSLKVTGWVGELQANAEGVLVTQGDVLFALYSPEIFSAQQEYLQALRSQEAAGGTSAPERADYLVRAAKKRLELWDIAPRDIEALARSQQVRDYIPIRAPASGYVIQKNVVEGAAVTAGSLLFRIAPIDRVWIEADLYESELPLVSIGQAASVTFSNQEGEPVAGSVSYIYPYLDSASRTGRIRIELPNPDLALRPDMYVNVSLRTQERQGIAVPQSAVLHAGDRSYVFVELGGGRFEPREIVVGARSGEELEVLRGLSAGERVVVSGTFLISSESRLQAALEDW